MKRKSSQGNPNHWPKGSSKGGQFAPKGSGISYFRDADYYEARSRFRNGEISKEEMDAVKSEYATPEEMEHFFGRNGVDFTPAKTVKGAEAYARSLGVEPYYKGLDLETCNALNESMANTLATFPKVKMYLHVCGNAQEINKQKKKEVTEHLESGDFGCFVSPQSKRAWAKKQANRIVGRARSRELAHVDIGARTIACKNVEEKFKGVYINTNNDVASAMKFCEETGYHPKGAGTVKGCMDHEMGHLIHFAYGGLKVNMRDKSIKDELSEYASTDVREYHAEAWSEFCNSPNPRARAREVGEEFLRRAKA